MEMTEYPARRNRCPMHPGVVLEDMIESIGQSKVAVAEALGISRQHLYDILRGKKPVSAQVATRIGKAFDDSPEVWMRMQAAYDIWQATHTVDLSKVKQLKKVA
jgi:antitoxin HigA-1